jgi:hypothetical protein
MVEGIKEGYNRITGEESVCLVVVENTPSYRRITSLKWNDIPHHPG